MVIHRFTAEHFRNYKHLAIAPSAHINVFFGENASGKTSLLEAIYYLGMGRSFRTRLLPHIFQHGESSFTLFALIKQDDHDITLGLERNRSGTRRLHINSRPQASQAMLVKYLPLLFISTNSYRYFYDGPKARRSFLDWGVFHVKPQFYGLWQRLQQALKQRNASLRQGLTKVQLKAWDIELVEVSEQIDAIRQEYVTQLVPYFNDLLHRLSSGFLPPLTLHYERGWSQELPLMDVLAINWRQDNYLGYTQAGPQRADLYITTEQRPAQEILSQGQQKQVAYSLYLAQGLLFKASNQRSPIYLIDDLPAELDNTRRQAIASVLIDLNSQVFVTGINCQSFEDMFNLKDCNMFHVKHGIITPA